jgi:hypothetical protein
MVKLMHPVNNSSFLSQVLSVSRSAILPSPPQYNQREGEQGKATQENAAIERKNNKEKENTNVQLLR